VKDVPAIPSSTVSAAPAVPKPEPAASSSAAAAAQSTKTSSSGSAGGSGSSAWSRLVAFTTGLGVSSLWYYYTISTDVWHSTAVIENSLAEFRKDTAATNRELRQRIAALEHQVVALKK